MFNAIENAWSSLKAGVKNDFSMQLPTILSDGQREDISRTKFRLQSLENIIQNNISKITVSYCASYVANIQRFIPDALSMADILF